MSGVRDISFLENSIKKNKGKGINMPKHLIDEVVQQHKEENNSKDTVLENQSGAQAKSFVTNDILEIQKAFEEEIKKLKIENEKLKSQTLDSGDFYQIKSRKLRNNFSKLVDAINVESKIQGTDWPILSTNKLRKTYKVTADSFKECLEYGLSEGLINRKEKSFSGNVGTWSYTLLK